MFVAAKVIPLIGSIVLLSACVQHPSGTIATPPTLTTEKRLPAHEIGALISPALWKEICNRVFEGYVIVEGPIDDYGRMIVRNEQHVYPDKSWLRHAPDVIKHVHLPPISVGSHLLPAARAYIVFYSTKAGPLALVYAKHDDFHGPRLPAPRAFLGFVSIREGQPSELTGSEMRTEQRGMLPLED